MAEIEPAAVEPLVSLAAVAAVLGVSKAAIYRWRQMGVGPVGYPIGREVKYRMSEVEAWIQAQKEELPAGTAAAS